jgi:hypothetical protein
MLCAAAYAIFISTQITDRQRQIGENTQFLDDSKICLESETDLHVRAEELKISHFKQFQKRISTFSHRSSEKAWYYSFTNNPSMITKHFALDDISFTFIRMASYGSSSNGEKHFNFMSLGINFTKENLWQNFDFQFCTEKFAYIKNSIFGKFFNFQTSDIPFNLKSFALISRPCPPYPACDPT